MASAHSQEAKVPKLNMSVSHRLPQEEAVRRVKSLLGKVKTHLPDKIIDLREKWNGNTVEFSFSVDGFSVSGTLSMKPEEVEIFGKLPFEARFVRTGKIESVIREQAKILLA